MLISKKSRIKWCLLEACGYRIEGGKKKLSCGFSAIVSQE